MEQQQTAIDYQQIDRKYYLPVFNRIPLTLVRGEGSYVWDSNGNRYIDAMAGIAVNAIGHCHPQVVQAIQSQSGQLMHISNFFVSPAQALLSGKLVQLSGQDRVFITNSGSESVETAIKLARKYAHGNGCGGTVLTFEGCFHGRTLATIAGGSPKYQQGFEPLPGGFKQVPFNDPVALEHAITEEVGVILLEPVQGEGGVRPAAPELVSAARKLCDRTGAALVFDEVQCGVGRTGKWFAGEHFGVKPDILALAKGLGGGFPVGAALCTEAVAEAIEYGDHGTTFGGNPLACSAALATLEVIESEGLVQYAAEQGQRLLETLRFRTNGNPAVTDVRGYGLMLGVELAFPGASVVQAMLKRGVIANCTREKVMRLVPPLNMPADELDQVVEVLLESITECAADGQD